MAGERLRIVGVGSPHGDDRVGWAVVERLEQLERPADVGLFRCAAPAADLLDLVQGARRLILVDAVDTGQPPGEVSTWSGEEILRVRSAVSSHGLDLGQILALGGALGSVPAEVTLFGISVAPAACAPQSAGLSPAVAHAAAEVVERIAAELRAAAAAPLERRWPTAL